MSYVYDFDSTLEEMRRLHQAKNSDYGNSIHDTYNKYGLLAYLVRIEDKVNRARTLTQNSASQAQVNESVRDTLMDLANYAALAVTELDAVYGRGKADGQG